MLVLAERQLTILTAKRNSYITTRNKQETHRQDGVRGGSTVANHNRVPFEIEIYITAIDDWIEQWYDYARWSNTFNAIRNTILQLAYFGVIALVYSEIISKKRSIGDMSILAALWNRLLASVTFLSSFVSSKIESLLDAASFREIMEKKPNFADGKHQLSLNEDTVEFSNVSFSCPGSTDMVIENLNLHIRGGSKVGIVGESGAGKSTLCDLLMRQIRPINGEIKIDGQNINDLSTES
ncbi:hypothetical protein PMIN04_012608 [Paraphaeosphaeria minitans]